METQMHCKIYWKVFLEEKNLLLYNKKSGTGCPTSPSVMVMKKLHFFGDLSPSVGNSCLSFSVSLGELASNLASR